MTLQSTREVEVTREKLRMLQAGYEDVRRNQSGDAHIRELTLRSLKRLINQLTEEITRFESRAAIRSSTTPPSGWGGSPT